VLLDPPDERGILKPMPESNFNWLGLCGAITGTVALLLNLRQWRHDRANVKVTAEVSITNTDINRHVHTVSFVVLTISVVNIGHRPASVKRVWVPITNESIPFPPGLTPEVLQNMRDTLQQTELVVFGGGNEKPIDLKQDGGHFQWTIQIKKGIKLLPDPKDKDSGNVFVELTSGDKILGKFYMLPADKWPINDQ